MSRILEFQPTDEQTIVARVLLDLHQAIDTSFPNAAESSRQFTKTVLSEIESTQADQRPGDVHSGAHSYSKSAPSKPEARKSASVTQTPPQAEAAARSSIAKNKKTGPSQTAQDAQSFQSDLEFSGADEDLKDLKGLTATSLSERPWSIWLTRLLIVSLLAGGVLLAWIHLFGPPTF